MDITEARDLLNDAHTLIHAIVMAAEDLDQDDASAISLIASLASERLDRAKEILGEVPEAGTA